MGASVSVFVPSYNYAHFLPDCVDSVLQQDGVDVRVLILDDASSDDTPAVAERLAADPRVTSVRHAVNRGHIATYNEGIDWADGDYTVLLSADDLLIPGALRRATELLDEHPEAGFAYGRAVSFATGDALPRPRVVPPDRYRVWPGRDWVAAICRWGLNVITSPEVVVRTGLHKEVGGYLPQLPRTGDLELWLRLAARADVAWLGGADQAYYRQHRSNMHITSLATAVQYTEQRRAAFEHFFAGSGHLLAGAGALRATALRALARKTLASACRDLDRGRVDLDGTTPRDLVDQLATFCDVTSLPEYRALQWRLRAGPRVLRVAGPAVGLATLRRPRAWWQVHVRRGRVL